MASLDPPTAHQVMRDLKALSREENLLTLVNLHFIDMAQEYADRVIGLRAGELVYDGPRDRHERVRFRGDLRAQDPPRRPARNRGMSKPGFPWRGWLAAAIVVAVLLWSAAGTKFDLPKLLSSGPQVMAFFAQMIPTAEHPWTTQILPEIGKRLLETLRIAVAATICGAALALPFPMVGARTMAAGKAVYAFGRGYLNLVRTIPDLVLATLIAVAFGYNAFLGVHGPASVLVRRRREASLRHGGDDRSRPDGGDRVGGRDAAPARALRRPSRRSRRTSRPTRSTPSRSTSAPPPCSGWWAQAASGRSFRSTRRSGTTTSSG